MKPGRNPKVNKNIPFDKCLRLVIGGRLKADRYRTWRAWSRAYLLKMFQVTGPAHLEFDSENVPHPVYAITELPPERDRTDELLKHFKEKGVDQWNFALMQRDIPEWRKEQRIKQRREAAIARWSKRTARSTKAPLDTIPKRRK
jgi:hypothetical protein